MLERWGLGKSVSAGAMRGQRLQDPGAGVTVVAESYWTSAGYKTWSSASTVHTLHLSYLSSPVSVRFNSYESK